MSSGDRSAPSPPAGWYPDPLDPRAERLWDGERWSERTRLTETGSVQPVAPPRPASPLDPPSDRPKRDRSGSGLSTGSIVGIGCGLLALLSVGGCVVLVGVVPLMAVRSQDGFVAEEVEIAVPAPQPTRGPVPIPPEPVEEFPPTTAGPGLATFGSSVEMVAVLGSGEAAAFEVAVEEPVDLTEAITAAGGPGLEAGDDRLLVGVPATVVLRESFTDAVPTAGLFEWTMVGATGTLHQPLAADSVGCDIIDEDLTAVEEFGIGEERQGIVCFLVPPEDFEPGTQLLLEVVGGAPITWIR